jgi:hypothetical protein
MFQQICRSSANKRHLESLILAEILFTKILNNRGPRVNCCGISDNREKEDENFPKMRTEEDVFNEQLLDNLT